MNESPRKRFERRRAELRREGDKVGFLFIGMVVVIVVGNLLLAAGVIFVVYRVGLWLGIW